MTDEYRQIAEFFRTAINKFGEGRRILDFGCGAGRLVEALERAGLEAHGCDVASYLAPDLDIPPDRFSHMALSPYRLPYPDDHFDAVISTSVLEHAQNSEEALLEIKRVLKPGGLSMHILPGKWYLPSEPHIFVPLVSWFWPNVPRWWLRFWAWAGVRNGFQTGMSAQEVAAQNERYVRENLIYPSTGQWNRLSRRVFGNVRWPMDLFLETAPGGMGRLYRRLPCKGLIAWLSRETRMGFMVQQKL